MATATKYDLLAEEILRGVGGEHNVAAVTHCATRLRFQIKDRDKVDKAAVENTKGVITVVEAGGQFQVVIGNTVSNVYESIANSTCISTSAEGGAQGGFLGKAIDLITSIFTPFLWVLAGTGLIKALLAVAVKFWPDFAGTRQLRDPVLGRGCDVPVPADPAGDHLGQEVRGQRVHLGGDRRGADLLVDHRGHPRRRRGHHHAERLRRRRREADLLRHPGDR